MTQQPHSQVLDHLKTHIHTQCTCNVYSNFIYNYQKLEANNMFFNIRHYKQTVVYPFNGKLFSNKK